MKRQSQIYPKKAFGTYHEATDIVCLGIDEELTFDWTIGVTKAGRFFPIANVRNTDSWAWSSTEERLKKLGFTII